MSAYSDAPMVDTSLIPVSHFDMQGDDGERRDYVEEPTRGVHVADGRGQPATPQLLTVLTVRSLKTERDRRLSAGVGLTRADLFAPHAGSDGEFNVRRGLLCFMMALDSSATFRPSMQAASPIQAYHNVAGLSRREAARVIGVCVMISDRDSDQPHTDDFCTVVVKGVQTIAHSGSVYVQTGDTLIADLNPLVSEDEAGNVVPGLHIKGVRGFHMQVRPLSSSRLDALQNMYEAALLERLALKSTHQALAKVAGPLELRRVLDNLVNDYCNEENLAQSMPIRAYLAVWLHWRFAKMMQAGTLPNEVPHTVRERVWALQALRFVLQSVEDDFRCAFSDYKLQLPHDTRLAVVSTNALTGTVEVASSAHWNGLNKLMGSDQLLATVRANEGGRGQAEATRMLLKAAAHVDMIADTVMKRLLLETAHYLKRFLIGTALCSAAKGQQLDINVGAFN